MLNIKKLEKHDSAKPICPKCGNYVSLENIFCGKCGASITSSTEPPRTITANPQRNPVSASDIIYLFADQFVEKPLLGGEKVPCTDRKIKRNRLVETLYAAAFIWLEEKGFVTLNAGKRKKWLGIRNPDSVIVARREQPFQLNQNSLESRIWSKMTGKDNARDLTYKAIGVYSVDVNGSIIKHVIGYLHEEGYFRAEKRLKVFTRYIPDCEKIVGLRRYVEETVSMISSFRGRKEQVYIQLLKDVKDAIKSRKKEEMD